VGIDVESFRHFSEGLLDKTMNPDEKAAILSSDSQEEKFASLWTCKEAVFKMQGTGITDNLHHILSGGVTTGTKINHEKGYALSVAW
jgi:phosphopantetheine--protein transferase-like protein